jgi:transposase
VGVVYSQQQGGAGLRLTVESHPAETGCPSCGVIAVGDGRRLRRLHDIPAFGAPVELVWRQRGYRFIGPASRWAGSARTIRWHRLRRS